MENSKPKREKVLIRKKKKFKILDPCSCSLLDGSKIVKFLFRSAQEQTPYTEGPITLTSLILYPIKLLPMDFY